MTFLSSPHMGGNEMKYVRKAYDTNWIAPLGPNVIGFENTLEKYIGNDVKVACLSSGTSAIHLALILAGVKKDDEVILPKFYLFGFCKPYYISRS